MKINYRHFTLFYIIALLFNCVSYFLMAEHYRHGTAAAQALNWTYLLFPVMLGIAMIATHKSGKRLDFLDKVLAASGLISLEIFTTLVLNLINPYRRIMTNEDITAGMENGFLYGSIQLVTLFIILFFVRSRLR